jgi:CDP-paratose synthetase
MTSGHVLVTGASGFIGSHFVVQMVNSCSVTILTRPESNLKHIETLLPQLDIIQIDIQNDWLSKLQKLQKANSLRIVHLATSYTGDAEIRTSNITMPIEIIDTLSSPNDHVFINTDTFFGKPSNENLVLPQYTQSKTEFYKQAKKKCFEKGIRFINMRLEHIYGINDSPKKFVPWLLNNLINNKENIELTNCDHIRDFLNVSDTIAAYKTILQNLGNINTNSEISVGSGIGTCVRDFVTLAKSLTKSTSNLCFGSIEDRGDIKQSIGNSEFLNSLGWQHTVTIEDGIRDLYEFLKQNT